MGKDRVFLRNAKMVLDLTETVTGFITIQEAENIIKSKLCLVGEVTFDWKSEEHLDKVLITAIISRSHTKEV